MTQAAPTPEGDDVAKPMPLQVSALNTVWIIRYLQEHHPELDLPAMLAAVNKPTPFYVVNLRTQQCEQVAIEHLVDGRYWFSNRFMMAFYKAIKARIPEPRLGYTIGRIAHQSHPVRRSAFFLAPLVGPRQLLKRIVKESNKFNRTKDILLLENRKTCTVIRLVHYAGIMVDDFAMDWHAGVFHAYAALTGARDVEIRWESRDPDLKTVDFEIRYRNPWLPQRLLRAFVFNLPAVKEALQKAEEIQEEHRRTILNQENIIKARTERIEAMQQQLLAQERMMTETYIAGGMAHEIRNTLGAAQLRLRQAAVALDQNAGDPSLARLLTHITRAEATAPDDQRTAVQAIRVLHENRRRMHGALAQIDLAVQRGLAIANRVMDYATLSGEDGRRSADVSRIAADLAGIYEEEWARQGIALKLALSDGVEVPRAPERIHSVLQNLMLNSRDAIHETGRGHGEIQIRVAPQGNEALIEVGDDGVGIAQEDCEKVFQPFFSTKPHAGMGLGLSECQKIVAAYGGRIAAIGSNGQGALLRVVLPIRAAKIENSDTTAPPATDEPPFAPLV